VDEIITHACISGSAKQRSWTVGIHVVTFTRIVATCKQNAAAKSEGAKIEANKKLDRNINVNS
jgi:hypothetical protein